MTVRRLSAVDAQTYWMSAKIPNDTVLLYGFAGVPADPEAAIEEIAERARGCPDLTVRIEDGGPLTYPAWVHRDVDRSFFVLHEGRTFQGCLDQVGEITAARLDPRVAAWRLDIFTDVEGVPGAAGPGTVAVLQISHALGGGGRTSAPAAIMFGRRDGVVPGIDAPRTRRICLLPILGFRAARAHRRMVEDTDAGRVPPPADLRPALRTNARPAGPRHLRTVVGRRSDLSGPTVTVAVLSAVSVALAEHLRGLGEDPSRLGAEVPMAKPPPRLAYNHFGNVGVGLYPELAEPERGLSDRRRPRRATPPSGAPWGACRGSGVRRDTRAAIALGYGPIRSRCPSDAGDRKHRRVQRELRRRRLHLRRCAGDGGDCLCRTVADDGPDACGRRRRRHDRDRVSTRPSRQSTIWSLTPND